jgi:hypothetical protein
LAYREAVAEGVLQRISCSLVHQRKRWVSCLILETIAVLDVLVPELRQTG